MSDFFSRLEDHLDDAARREAGGAPRRTGHPPQAGRWTVPFVRRLALVAAVLAVVAIGAAALPRIAADDTEQAADTGTNTFKVIPDDCRKQHGTAVPVAGGPYPEAVRERFAVLRGGKQSVEVSAEDFAGLPVWGVQVKDARQVAEQGGARYFLVPVGDVRTDGCAPVSERPAADRTPGACLLMKAGPAWAVGCWTLNDLEYGEGILGPKPGIPGTEPSGRIAALVPDGHTAIDIEGFGDDPRLQELGVEDGNIVAVAVDEDLRAVAPRRWRDAGLTPVDKTGSPPDYGCDGPVHPETLAEYSVLKNDPDPGARFDAPEGTTFLSEPVLAREAFGHKFWLIAAADQGDCSQPVICIVTDFGAEVPQCNLIQEGSALLYTRVKPGGEPSLVMFGAAPDGMPDKREERKGIEPIDLSAENNVVVGALTLSEEDSRKAAEAFGGTVLPKGGDGLTADHDDR